MRRKRKKRKKWSNLRRCLNLELSWLSYRFNSYSWREKNNVIRAYISGRYPRESLGGGYPPQRYAPTHPQGKTIIFLQCTSLAWCVRSDARREDYHFSFLDARLKSPRILRETILEPPSNFDPRFLLPGPILDVNGALISSKPPSSSGANYAPVITLASLSASLWLRK